MHNIVVLGANFAGIPVTHYLLRHVLPPLNSMGVGTYKVTLVSPSTRFFFKVGAPRALTSAEAVPLDHSFLSIPEAFKDYNPSHFTFIQGEAVGIDEVGKRVIVTQPMDGLTTDLEYESLIIATGTTSKSALWTLHGDYTITRDAFKDLHARLPKAQRIAIVGGGPSGVETAGEIAYRFKDRDITLLSGTTRLLSNLKNTGVSATAEKKLKALNVSIVHGLKVLSSKENASGKTILALSDGNTEEFDLVIDATGGQPNSSFLPIAWLDERLRVGTDTTTLRVLEAPAGVYGIGDVASYSRGNILDVRDAVAPLCYSVWFDSYQLAVAARKKDGKETGMTMPQVLKESKLKLIESDMQVVPIGPEGGVGVLFGWRVPSWVVWLHKSRTMFFEKAPGLVAGADYVKP
ncbi:FAD/NAD(P)-binding domain-containing protein [Mytilinidion resinicola]|uniref:FAD/NAD(P)-binding domain-containing protein n=1 Tax=Mytilinidion resinicola TaxID=574789 RepID=A0A6A6YTG9_9PEZI|nr:FAD/NAD(P)-binding domain-containing protein [Mytilinidion resinicola]KAF2811819.1 FAD/NAD(P)-binding domain-containing protein [Mytilinidion resinicola]